MTSIRMEVIISEIKSTIYADELIISTYGTTPGDCLPKNDFTIRVTNPNLLGTFKAGQIFHLDFIPA